MGLGDIVSEFPVTAILLAVGLFIGLSLPSGTDYFLNGNWLNASNPQETLTGAVIGFPIAIFIEVISGLIGALLGGLIGLIIDGIIKGTGGSSRGI